MELLILLSIFILINSYSFFTVSDSQDQLYKETAADTHYNRK